MPRLGSTVVSESLHIRVLGEVGQPTLVYLPGIHGDWTLVSSFRAALAGRVRFVEFTYPRTLDWTLADYAAAIEQQLLAHGIRCGWLLGESFGSQPAWLLCPGGAAGRGFEATGLILAGGFVRHPAMWAVRAARVAVANLPLPWLRLWLSLYARFARFRHRHAPETLAAIGEFIARRTDLDRRAIVHRLDLIAAADLRPVARAVDLPVFYLAGLADPIVPWPFVRAWLRRHCPGYRGGVTIWNADHNVLGTAPTACAAQVSRWMAAAAGPA